MSFFRIKNRVDEQQAAETVSSAAAENAVQTETFDDPGILCEELSFRRENETVYRRNDGTSRAVITSTPTHYFDKQTQSYRRIDNRLLDGGEMLETSENDVKVQLAKSAVQAKTMRLEKDGISVEWVYQPKTVTTRAAVSASVGSMNTSAVKASSDNSIRYEDIDENVDLEYSLLGSNVKENIVVKARGQQYRFDFRLKTNAFLRLSEDSRSIELCASGEADAPATFTIPSPFMYDARGERSDEVCYEVESQHDGEYRFTVVADAEWINSEEVVLPVTIDPQIISYDASFYSKTIYSKNLSSSTASWSIWSTSPVNGIKVQRDLYTEYKTTLTVYKSKFDLLDRKMIMAKLILTPKTLSQTGRIKVGDREYEVTSLNKVECDITKKMNAAGNTFTVDITAASYGLVNVVFEEYGTNGPMLEIDYLTNENSIPQKMQFSGIARASTELDLLTRELTAEISDVKPGDSFAGVGISHVFKKSGEDFHCGANFRLNLNERLYRNDDDLLNANYIYEDAKGDKHGFKEYFYYLQAGVKTYVSYKSQITVELDGTLKYNGKEVFKEERSATGLQAVMQIEGVKNVENLEQRQKELIEVQSQMEAYEERLESYVVVSRSDSTIYKYLRGNYKTEADFKTFMNLANSYNYFLFTENEAYIYQSLDFQIRGATLNLPELEQKVTDAYNVLEEARTKHPNEPNHADIQAAQKTYNEAVANRNLLSAENDANTSRFNGMKTQESARIEQLKKYYKEYVNLVYQEQALRRQIPVNFLRSETLVKGFNEYGNLVAIYDGYENTVTVEWDEANQKILRVYDGEEKEIRFDYGDDGLLASITDARGRRVTYEYLSSGVKFTYANGKVLNATYDTQKNLNGVRSPDLEAIAVSYTNNRVYSLTHLSNASEIAHGVEPQTGLAVIASLAVADYQDGVKLTDQNGKVSVYVFNGDGNLSEYYVEEGGVVVQAEQYSHENYQWDKTDYAKKSLLYTAPLSEFAFEKENYQYITLDAFNQPQSSETGWETLNVGMSGTLKQKQTVEYTYDGDHQLIQARMTVITDHAGEQSSDYVVKKYQYNGMGRVTRTESYVEGEELTSGIAIEENVYDAKGNLIRTVSYNSLDSSAKFYRESVREENGQVTAELDETGENQTSYEYVEGTNIVRSRLNPDGGKLAYGMDEEDTVTSITQSTEEGEANGTQMSYSCGLLTELRSANNVVRYAYDSKRRLRSVKLNSDQNYVTYIYTDNQTYNGKSVDQVQAMYASRSLGVTDVFDTTTDKHGNLIRVQYNGSPQVEYTYDAKDRLTNLTDGESGNTAFCTYDNYDRRLGYFESNAAAASNPIYDEQFTYNMYGDLATAHYGFGTDSHEYALSYREDFARTLDSVTYTKGEADLTVWPQSDCLGRNTGKELEVGGSKIAEERRYYRQVGDHATNMVSAIRYGGMQNGKYALNDSVKYVYDKLGNVEKVYENGALTARYTYDRLNRLIREDNKKLNRTFLYEYDNNGNILSRREYLFTLEVREALEECTKQDGGDLTTQKYREYLYNYVDDRLISYDGEQYAYDALGNPTTYRGKSVSWSKGRQMDSYDGTGFTYDGRGRRIAKGSLTFSYTSDGKLIKQSNGIEFIYDNSGVVGINYNGIIYVYRKNIFGDIVNLLDNSGNIVVKYEYDSWGNHIVKNADGTINNSADFIGNLNPIRYRGYYYDSDINLYYLKTRYYDPETGRFVTIDDVKFIAPNIINGLNLYAYCANNPVMRLDPTGNSFALLIFGIFLVVSLFTLTYSSSDSNDKKVYYDVPLYSQGGLNLCWAYCQVMVEAYQSNTKLTQKEADARAKEIAIKRNGADNWNRSGWPSNKGKGIDVSNIEELYNALIENGGPLYAYYWDGGSIAHLVVVTGVNLTRGIVYTNNPWNVRGEQSFSAFQNGVAKYPWHLDGGMSLYWVYFTT